MSGEHDYRPAVRTGHYRAILRAVVSYVITCRSHVIMEFLACRNGALLRVIGVGGHLIPYDRYARRELERTARRCACGWVTGSGTARTCGEPACIARLAGTPAT